MPSARLWDRLCPLRKHDTAVALTQVRRSPARARASDAAGSTTGRTGWQGTQAMPVLAAEKPAKHAEHAEAPDALLTRPLGQGMHVGAAVVLEKRPFVHAK